MTYSGLTKAVHASSQFSGREGAKIDMVILHHAASTSASGVIGMMTSGTRQVSSNYVVDRDGTLHGVIPEEQRAWTSGSSTDGGKGAAFDRRAITFETVNEKSGDPWPISEASYETLASVLVDLHQRYGIALDRDHVVGHRELWTRYKASYATACPGGMDIDRVVNMARERVGQPAISPAGGSVLIPIVAGPSTGSNITNRPTADIQRLVGATADGIYGPGTTEKVKAWQAANGLTADGIWGPGSDAKGFPASTPTPAPKETTVATYSNGQIPRSVMKTFRNTGKYGHPQFINQLEAAFQEASRNGIGLSISSGQDIFRDYAGQQYWRNYWVSRGRPGNAAIPGTSNHGLGIAADISGMGNWGSTTHNRVRAIMRRHGLDFTVRSESWHVQATNISTAGNRVSINGTASGGFSGNSFFPSTAAFAAVQGGYNALGYGLTQDGLNGPKTTAAVRDFQSKHGLVVDGIHGPGTEKALIAAVAAKQGKPTGSGIAVDGIWGQGTTKALQRAVGATADGILGPNTYKAIQRRVGTPADGIWGPNSRKALQRHLGVTQDGIVGKGTIRALQSRLNAGNF